MSFGLHTSRANEGSLVVESLRLRVRSIGLLANTEISFLYRNNLPSPVEVEFLMPVDSNSVVTGLTARLGRREIRAEVRGKDEARDLYDNALASGGTAAYGEQREKDIFKMNLGNLPGGASAEVELSLLEELEISDRYLRYFLPITMKPRYSPIASSAEPHQSVRCSLSLSMRAGYTGGLVGVSSPSHPIACEVVEGGDVQVQLCDDTSHLDKDLIVLIEPCSPDVPSLVWGSPRSGSLESETRSLGNSPAFMVNFIPCFNTSAESCSSEVVFIVDRSGSMSGQPIDSAKATLSLLLRSLQPGCYFNIIGFGSNFTKLYSGGSIAYNQKSLEAASRHVSSISADMGGTEILSPLQSVFTEKPITGVSKQIVVLTDGSVSNTAEVINLVRSWRNRVRVFSIGIGYGASTQLIRGVAQAGGGRAVFVSENERMQTKIMSLLVDVMSPCCSDVKLSEVEGVSFFPSSLPQLFNGDRLVVYGFETGAVTGCANAGVLSLEYRRGDRQYCHRISLERGGDVSPVSTWVHSLACRAVLQEWSSVPDKIVECVDLSCQAGIVCEHTALVGVDQSTPVPVEACMELHRLTVANVSQNHNIMLRAIPQSDNSKKSCCAGGGGGGGGGSSRGYSKLPSIPNSPDSLFASEDSRTGVVSPHEKLCTLQTAEGFWEASTQVNELLGVDVGSSLPSGLDVRVWATVLCLAVLETRYSQFKLEWQLVSRKAEKWLNTSHLHKSLALDEVKQLANQCLQPAKC